jgi:hypothetical protein
LRAYLKKEWPKEAAKIDDLSDDELHAQYKKTIARYGQQGTAAQEVDY